MWRSIRLIFSTSCEVILTSFTSTSVFIKDSPKIDIRIELMLSKRVPTLTQMNTIVTVDIDVPLSIFWK